jgi:hypothetical protein
MNIAGTWTRIHIQEKDCAVPSYLIWRGAGILFSQGYVPEIGEEHSWDHYYFHRSHVDKLVEQVKIRYPDAGIVTEAFTVTVSAMTTKVIQ